MVSLYSTVRVVVYGHAVFCGVFASALKARVCAFRNEHFSEFGVKDLLSTDLGIVQGSRDIGDASLGITFIEN